MTHQKKLFAPPPYKSDLYLKRTISVSYWKDSNELLWRASIYKQHIEWDNLSTKAKTYVDIIMAVECALKSIIISLSLKTETPENAYLKARACSHNLTKLYEEVKCRAKNRTKLLSLNDETILNKANTLGVGYRYEVTSFMLLSQEEWADRNEKKGIVSSILNHDFIDNLYKVAIRLNTIAGQIEKKYLGKYAIANMAKWEETEDRHKRFLTNLGRKF